MVPPQGTHTGGHDAKTPGRGRLREGSGLFSFCHRKGDTAMPFGLTLVLINFAIVGFVVGYSFHAATHA